MTKEWCYDWRPIGQIWDWCPRSQEIMKTTPLIIPVGFVLTQVCENRSMTHQWEKQSVSHGTTKQMTVPGQRWDWLGCSKLSFVRQVRSQVEPWEFRLYPDMWFVGKSAHQSYYLRKVTRISSKQTGWSIRIQSEYIKILKLDQEYVEIQIVDDMLIVKKNKKNKSIIEEPDWWD